MDRCDQNIPVFVLMAVLVGGCSGSGQGDVCASYVCSFHGECVIDGSGGIAESCV